MTRAAGVWSRVLAFGLDYLVMLLYIALLFVLSRTVLSSLLPADLAPGQAQLLGFVSLTLPVVLYFAVSESLAGATLGKRLLSLQVRSLSGERLSLPRSFVRSGVKFLPWEISHTAVYRVVQPDASGWWSYLFFVSLGLAGLYLVTLFRLPHRPPYDRLSGAAVQRFTFTTSKEVPA